MKIPIAIQNKLLYSKRLLELLDSRIEGYLNEKSDEVITEEYQSLSGFTSAIEGRTVPVVIPLICGDVLQNTRSILDYLVWELVLANNEQPNDANAFPVCKSPNTFKDAQKRKLRGVHADAIALIEGLQFYHFGQGNECESVLFVLNELTNINKHRSILIARERHAPTDLIDVFDSAGNFIGFDPLRASDPKATVKFIDDALKMNMKPQIAIFVEFGEYPAKGVEVIAALNGLYNGVALEIIPRFNRFFA